MKLHRHTARGIEDFARFLDTLVTEKPAPVPKELLTDPARTEPIDPPTDVADRRFASRFELAAYLYELLGRARLAAPENDRGLWTWLALYYFEQLCPPDENGRRRPGERARWIPFVGDYRRYYRHLLAGPYRVYKAHRDNPDRTLALLCGPVHEISNVYLEIAKRQELVTNPTVVEAATRLYYDPDREQVKRMGTIAAPGNPGTVRRFAEVLLQLDVVWDLAAMSAEELIKLLPKEFDRFRSRG